MKRYIGLRNIVTSKSDWKYLLFYEIDSHDEDKIVTIDSYFYRVGISYIAYSTLNGCHFVGLSPINAQQWGYHFQTLQNIVPEYFSGQTLRLSLKEGEKQELIRTNLNYPFLQKLTFMYCRRFNIDKSEIPIYGEPPNYTSVFERYWTTKQI
jgi:hypothetical protein